MQTACQHRATLSSAIELLQDDIEKALSLSDAFTVIDIILAQEDMVGTQVDTYTSLVSALNAGLLTNFSGIFTAFNTTSTQVQILLVAQSALVNVSSELRTIQNSFGFPIYARDLPLTITTGGRYYFAEDINYSGSSKCNNH